MVPFLQFSAFRNLYFSGTAQAKEYLVLWVGQQSVLRAFH
jgi:hypothetical protein